MRCYRCGETFGWTHAESVQPIHADTDTDSTADAAGPYDPAVSGDETDASGISAVLSKIGNAVGMPAPVLIPLVVATCLVVWTYHHDPTPSVLRATRLAPLAERAWTWVPASIQSGTHTWLPWPTEPLDRWYAAPYLETAVWVVSSGLVWLEIVHAVASGIALVALLAAMSPLGDRSGSQQSVVARATAVAAVVAGVASLAMVIRFSAEAWAYGPAGVVAAGEFVLGHLVNVVQWVLFSHLGDTFRLLTTLVRGASCVSLRLCVRERAPYVTSLCAYLLYTCIMTPSEHDTPFRPYSAFCPCIQIRRFAPLPSHSCRIERYTRAVLTNDFIYCNHHRPDVRCDCARTWKPSAGVLTNLRRLSCFRVHKTCTRTSVLFCRVRSLYCCALPWSKISFILLQLSIAFFITEEMIVVTRASA